MTDHDPDLFDEFLEKACLTVARSAERALLHRTTSAVLELCSTANSSYCELIQEGVAAGMMLSDDELDCRPGCDGDCCTLQVNCSIPEVISAASYIQHTLGETARTEALEKNEALLRACGGLPWDRRPLHHCPLLAEMSCSIYPARPVVCRGYVSSDISVCRLRLEPRPLYDQVPADWHRMRAAHAYSQGMMHGAEWTGLESFLVDFHFALDLVLRDPRLVERWFAGEDVFRDAELVRP